LTDDDDNNVTIIVYFPSRAFAHPGKWSQLTPWKMGEKLKIENMQKEQFSQWGWGGSGGDKIFLASGGKGALIPLTKILQTLALVVMFSR